VEAEPQIQRVLDLVHRRDELVEEKKRRTADIDAEIAKIDRDLRVAGNGIQHAEQTAPAGQHSLGLKPVRAGSYAEKVLIALGGNPAMGIGELAIAVYGDDTDSSRHKIRALQFHLRRSGRLAKPSKQHVTAA
jgi:hypothetical protein